MWYLQMMEGIFGSRANMLRFHIAVGLTWIAVSLFMQFPASETIFELSAAARIGLDRDDVQWLKVRTQLLLNRTKDPLPPQGAYNAGPEALCTAGLHDGPAH